MLETLDLSPKVTKEEYKKVKSEAEITLGALQRQAKELDVPVIIVFEGWSAAGKGTLINELILPLDPRGFSVHSAGDPRKRRPTIRSCGGSGADAATRPDCHLRPQLEPPRGNRPGRRASQGETPGGFEDIRSFERKLTDDGRSSSSASFISPRTSRSGGSTLRENPTTAWRVSKEDLRQHEATPSTWPR